MAQKTFASRVFYPPKYVQSNEPQGGTKSDNIPWLKPPSLHLQVYIG